MNPAWALLRAELHAKRPKRWKPSPLLGLLGRLAALALAWSLIVGSVAGTAWALGQEGSLGERVLNATLLFPEFALLGVRIVGEMTPESAPAARAG